MQTHLVDILLDHHIPIEDWGENPLERLKELDGVIGSRQGMLAFTERGRLILRTLKLFLEVRRCGLQWLVPSHIVMAGKQNCPIPDLGYTFSREVRPDCDENEALLSMLRRIGISPGVSEFELYCLREEEGETRLSARYPGILECSSSATFVWEMLDPYYRHQYSERRPDRSIVYHWFGPIG